MSDNDSLGAERFLGLLRPIERELEVYARRLVWNREDAPDALQNAALRAFRAFDRYHDDGSFRAWMFKIVTHEVFALNRKHGRLAQHEYAAGHSAACPPVASVKASRRVQRCCCQCGAPS